MDLTPATPASVEEHLATVLAAARPLPSLVVPVADAAGATLAAAATATVDLPPFENSAMDGFAVRAIDVADATAAAPVSLRVVGDLPAGSADDPRLEAGEAVRIMTGSPVPSGADTVVPFEDTVGGLADSLDRAVVRSAPRCPGAHVRRRGEDTVRGDVVLAAGVPLGPLQLGALAAAGIAHVEVTRAPRVVVVSTGSELVPVGQPLQRGQIPESNGTLLAAQVASAGARVVRRAVVDDEGATLALLLAEVTAGPDAADVVVFTGGVSAGAYEVVRQTVTQMRFGPVAMQPGKPQGFGVAGDTLLFGLPGNPVSAAVSFEVFVRPALLALQGRTDLHRPVLRMPAAAGWRTPPARRQYLPVRVDRSEPAGWLAVPASAGGSHLAGRLGGADGYAVVPADVETVAAGDLVDVMLID
ncbi:gephyrin-like molybdotransferase Glp [uncultured Microbacterium sp.]|uniref:molybdopterin molybdotransferase MoeA n=1 Tax=uncultured Microbacterium sp. TaxID=191216 RepID=UPI0025EAAD51|nr:gephyrin-like molybdotransferase Glp [uncultured Microbacterium sp.]